MRSVDFILESYINLIGQDENKHQYKDEVFGLIQKAYATIGGTRSNGFNSPDDMVALIPFWKLARKDGKIIACAMYGDKGGRKRLAVATDGTEIGKQALADVVKSDLKQKRSYGEISGSSLSFTKKHLASGMLEKLAILPARVAEVSGKSIRVPPIDDPELLRHPELSKFFYQRQLGGYWHTKLMIGYEGNSII